ncbi:uncharacterized protein LOC121390876, partial [Gigantopelta aegis]|uniref:uncharacterized protein LOC121390876 n=1 Tax=Gigantopelta aegis TaxID=1735272 RepID=UPI001B88B7C9
MNTSLCNEVTYSKWIFTLCNGKSQCEHDVLKSRDFHKCKNITAAQVKYNCVNNNSTLDMCTDVSLERNTSSSVIYLKSPGFRDSLASNKECTCIVKTEGNFMRFQILDLSFLYNDSKGEHPSFTANNADKTLWDTEKERNLSCPALTCSSFKKQKLNITNGQKHVQIFYNNKNLSQQNLWIEITGKSTIYCCNNSTLDICTDVSLERNTSSSVIYLKSPGFPNSLASEKE